jgi:hypothetical protein
MSKALNQTRYTRLIDAARQRSVPEGYRERHHIKPRSCGGTDAPDNLVLLTAREHFLAHWLLYRIERTPDAARAFKLMAHDQKRRRGRDYAAARQVMSEAMRGDKNVSRRPEVRAKLIANSVSPFHGKKRPEHAALLRNKGLFLGDKNPFFGCGEQQRGAKNHMAVPIIGKHKYGILMQWSTLQAAADAIGVTIQAVCQALSKQRRSKGWTFERVA